MRTPLRRGAVIEPKLVPGGLVVWADWHVLVVLATDDGKLLVA
ncbi:MAG: hypothetical protein QN120_05100 [Armatimonadota bacterium]|nr:hypothetical protein [Armatimonadota bacterium]